MNNQSSSLPPAVFLMGPTATGKTDLAVELVRRFPFEIISVDSVMVYRGMDIGTAKPPADVLHRAPHRLIDIRDPAQPYSAGEFQQDALKAMDEITANGRVPLLVGGTMLYFRALENGLSDLPSADADIRKRLESEAAQHGWEHLHQRLQALDPVSAKRIHPNDPQRIQRALEVYEITGDTLTELQQKHKRHPPSRRYVKLAMMPDDREGLNGRIKERFQTMVEDGFLDEVERFYLRADMNADLPAMRAVGYRQAWQFLAGQTGHEWVEQGIAATRQYAKRQMTWLRGQEQLLALVPGGETMLDVALKHLKSRVFPQDVPG